MIDKIKLSYSYELDDKEVKQELLVGEVPLPKTIEEYHTFLHEKESTFHRLFGYLEDMLKVELARDGEGWTQEKVAAETLKVIQK